jgi:mono/diheme cytochrome c family protein
MMKSIRSYASLAAVVALLSGVSFAQSGGEATYKAKCQMCHGATGMADTGAGKSMKVKPVTDPDVKKMTEAEMITVTTAGKGKMPAYKDKLTDAQIKDAVAYYRSLGK